jgi:hypothetical protein
MPYPLDLAPSDYVLFDKMKDVLHVARLVCYIHQEVTRKIAKVLTSRGTMCSVLKCDYAAVIISEPVFQGSPL